MNKVNLNTISLNSSSLNEIGEVKMGGASGGGGLDAIGVFIYDIDGKLTAPEDWDSANNDKAVGVYVGTDTHRFVVTKKRASNIVWGGYGILVNNIVTTDDRDIAILDFEGEKNTNEIVSQLQGISDEKGTIGAPTCEYCTNIIFHNGKRGYLPALGELVMCYNNFDSIQSAMIKCGGGEFLTWYSSSTQVDNTKVWFVFKSSLNNLVVVTILKFFICFCVDI
jgi:hypothetical protein